MCDNYEPSTEDDVELLHDLGELLDEANVVVAHNGDRFDLKKINTRMIKESFWKPTPYRTVDTLKIARREFGFTSNKLDYLAQFLFGDAKLDTGGLELWTDCLAGKPEAWDKMEDYNAKDVVLLERVYEHIKGWDRSHPNMALLAKSDEAACTKCVSTNVHECEDRYASTNVSLFPVYRCHDCGNIMRGRTSVLSKEQKSVLLVNAK
jgi:RNase P subunit RPR2